MMHIREVPKPGCGVDKSVIFMIVEEYIQIRLNSTLRGFKQVPIIANEHYVRNQ